MGRAISRLIIHTYCAREMYLTEVLLLFQTWQYHIECDFSFTCRLSKIMALFSPVIRCVSALGTVVILVNVEMQNVDEKNMKIT